jgi:hypothetical protein
MPFRPLPTIFTEHLSRLEPDSDVVLELGSGPGDFQALVAAAGHRSWGLDWRPPAAGTACDLVGDARLAPVRPQALTILVAANLVRHLAPRRRLPEFIARWRHLLKPGGALYVFEDEPGRATAAQANYRDLQSFLAQLMPETRGTLLARERFAQLVGADSEPGAWTFGSAANRSPLDAQAVLKFLAGSAGPPTGPVAGLMRRIGRDGLDPGRYWWARVGPGATGGQTTSEVSEVQR